MAVTFTVDAFVSHWTTTFVSCSAHRLNAGPSIRAGVLQTLALRYWMKEKKGRLWALKRDINRLWSNSFMFHQIITVPNWILWKVRLKVGLVEKVMWKDYPLQGKTHFFGSLCVYPSGHFPFYKRQSTPTFGDVDLFRHGDGRLWNCNGVSCPNL